MSFVTILFIILSVVLGGLATLPWIFFGFTILKRILKFRKTSVEVQAVAPTAKRDVTVIVPFHGEWELIVGCLESIVAQDFPGTIHARVVSNRQNSERLKALIDQLNRAHRSVQVVVSPDDRKSRKLNLCLAVVETSFVAILDADHEADQAWLSSSLELLHNHPSWSGVQCVRKPIVKGGVIYAWDSFINHVGNEFFNTLRSMARLNVPFTGTSAVFRREVFEGVPFGDSMTEDTEWYFKRVFLEKNKATFIGYNEKSGSRELMAKDLRTLMARRLRWATGHTQSFFNVYKQVKLSWTKHFPELFHGFYFTTSVPFVFFILLNYLFLFLQMNVPMRALIVAATVLLALIVRLYSVFRGHAYWIGLIFSFMFVSFFVVFLSGFTNIGFDAIVSRFGLVMLPIAVSILQVGMIVYFIFTGCALYFVRSNVPVSYIFKSLFFSFFYIPMEVVGSFYGVFNINSDNRWSTSRTNRSGLYEKITLWILILTLLSSIWIFIDGRDLRLFSRDIQAYFSNEVHPKKNIHFGPQNKIRGIAMSVSPNLEMIKRFEEIGVNAFRYYKDPGLKWVDEAYRRGIYSILQPSFSNWDHVDVRQKWSREYLLWSLFYLDSKYRDNPAVPFLILGNEIELWSFFEETDPEVIAELKDDFFKNFKDMYKKLGPASHQFGLATPVVDSGSYAPFLLPNLLSTSPYYWEETILKNKTSEKTVFVGEWGGFHAPDESPPHWLRAYRSELLWRLFDEQQFSGGFFFASTDNPSQPIMLSFNDPLDDEDPEDARGVLDQNNQPKEIFWNVAFLYAPLKVYKMNEEFYLKNTSQVTYRNLDLGFGQPVKELFSPNESLRITPVINALPKADRYVRYQTEQGGTQRLLIYHYPGRISGCIKPIPSNYKDELNSIFIAEHDEIGAVKAQNAAMHFSGKKGSIELHPKARDWSVSGIKKDSLKLLVECRLPFHHQREP